MEKNKNAEYKIDEVLKKTYNKFKKTGGGKLPTYIPELANVDPNIYSIVIISCCGKIYKIGDYKTKIAIESISKVFTLCEALMEYNMDYLLEKIGTQTSFLPYNSILALKLSKSYTINPFVNPGALATTSLIKGKNENIIFNKLLKNMSNFAGRDLKLSKKLYNSDSEVNYHNIAFAYLLKSRNKLYNNIEDTVNIYTKQCSVLADSIDLATMAATLANNGINPITKKKVCKKMYIPYVLSAMMGGGVYNDSGKWMNTIGIPAKSGVGGGLIGVVPGKYGIATISPPLDKNGNSVKGIKTFRELSRKLKLNMFESKDNCLIEC